MQFRQLRYFVKIIEAGSFSRAASVVHVAQPALSQQVAELEERLGVALLQRSARGVRPTAAGEILYKEAAAILRQLDQLPAVVRSSSGEVEGTVNLGFVSSLAPRLVGFLDECRAAFPKVVIRVSDGDSLSLEAKIASSSVDLAILYEDAFTTALTRKPLFKQKLFLISHQPIEGPGDVISLARVAELALVLPGMTNGRRALIERVFAEAELSRTSFSKPIRSSAKCGRCETRPAAPSCPSATSPISGRTPLQSRLRSIRRSISHARSSILPTFRSPLPARSCATGSWISSNAGLARPRCRVRSGSQDNYDPRRSLQFSYCTMACATLPQSLGAGAPAKRSIIQATAASALSRATKP